MFPKLLKTIIPGMVGVIAIALSDYLESFKVPTLVAVIIAGIVAVCFSLVVDEFLIGAKKHSLFLRKILDKRARFEGDWFVFQDEGSRMPYGAVSIDYNIETDGYTYKGAAYTASGDTGSEWFCDNLQFEIANSRVRFIAQTIVKGEAGAEHVSYGWISFIKVHGRRRMRYARGNGFFQIIGKPEMKGEFRVERLDPCFIEKVLGVPHISTTEDNTKVVQAYHQKQLENQSRSQTK
jgi:hypothetical protein